MSLASVTPWILLVAVVAGMGIVTLRRRRRPKHVPQKKATETPAVEAPLPDDRTLLRAYALDALNDAVLITDREGRVRDCNSSALTLFDRHRAVLESQPAGVLRRFEGFDQGDPHRVASERAVWIGEAWARQPDGGVKLCLARVIAIRDGRARITGFVESFRDITAERNWSEEFRDLLYGVRAFDAAAATPSENVRAVREELRLLTEAFRDLDLVIRQYERLLASLGSDDPLTESIAGAANDARAAVASVGVPTLLEEIPRALARLRAILQQVELESSMAEPAVAVKEMEGPALH